MVRIVNWLLTRRCNLRCEYCGIVKVKSVGKPISHFNKNEISTERVITLLNKFRTYNPNIFHIFYGGEPFLRSDLSDIIKFCNENDILYTIISNCTLDIRDKIFNVMNDVGGFRGFTGSVDPTILMGPNNSHSVLKSSNAFRFLMTMRKYVNDVVAEVTMTEESISYTYELIKMLSDVGIYSSLGAIDINKNYTYDFSAYSDKKWLIKDSTKLKELFFKLMIDDSLLIHMKDEILPSLFRHISSDYDCGMGHLSIHNLTIDADGSIRTCLRMRGEEIPILFNDTNILCPSDNNGFKLSSYFYIAMNSERSHCEGCNHTCAMMSRYIDENEDEHRKIIDH